MPPATRRPPMYLLVGSEELLLHRAAERLLDEVRAEVGELDVVDMRAAEVKDNGLPDLRTASLFGAPRALVVRDAQELPATATAQLAAELAAGPGEATVVLLASGTGAIQGLAKRIKEVGGRIDIQPPREWEDRQWEGLVADEFRRHGRTADRGAVAAVLAHAGLDVGGIAEKVAQAAQAATGATVTAAHVDAVVVGHGNRGSFAVAEAMCDGDPAAALTLLRGVLAAGDHPVMVLGALVYRLRSIVAVAGKLEPKAVGLNLSPGQVKRLQGTRRRFGPGQLTAAYRELADADAQLKGGELPPDLVLERAVVAIAARG